MPREPRLRVHRRFRAAVAARPLTNRPPKAAAEKFDPETKTFADQWIKKMLASKDDKAEMVGLLDECLIDENSSNCVEFEEALTALQQLVGGIAAEQF